MEFGKIQNVNEVNWRLPPSDPVSDRFLARIDKPNSMRIRYGTPAWGHKSWIGKVYPQKTKAKDFLFHYSRVYSTIELNTTHYRIPTLEQTRRWREQTPSDFLFCPKIFNGLSHARHGLLDRKLWLEWFRFLTDLGAQAGPCFLQLPPQFDYSQKAELFSLLKSWPVEFKLSLEFRHPTWFKDGRVLPLLNEYLQMRRVGLVITDVAGRRDVLHTSISADFCLVRFIGNDLHPSDYTRAHDWSARFHDWEIAGLKELYLFIHEPEDVNAPEMTEAFLSELKEAGLKVDLFKTSGGVLESLEVQPPLC